MAYQVNENMGIGDATVGISRTGIENYRQDLNFKVVNKTKDELRNYKSIVDTIGTSWNGAAAQKFVNNFHTSTEKACEALDAIGDAINALFDTIKNSMIKQDEEMIEEGDIAF